jgi:hypothetical protein
MVGEAGVKFYNFLQECAKSSDFAACIDTLADTDQRQDEELVLRFFALKNGQDLFKGSVRDWLDDFMEEVLFNRRPFDYETERLEFERLFRFMRKALGSGAFVKYRNNEPIGGLAPAYFEAVSIGTWNSLSLIEHSIPMENIKRKIIQSVQSDEFREQVGPGSNSIPKQKRRIEIIQKALAGLVK